MTDWSKAACLRLDVDSNWWHSDEKGQRHARETAEAKRICKQQCPLKTECLTLALEREAELPEQGRWGVWGATDGVERAAMARGGF